MTLFLCIISAISAIVATLFVNGVFPLKETIDEIWRSKMLAAVVLLGLFGIVGIFQDWTLVSAVCILILCGLVVFSKVFSKNEFEERVKTMQFWLEVKLKELELLIEEKFEDKEPLKDEVNKVIEGKAKEILELTDEQLRNARCEGGKFFVDVDKNKKARK